MVGAGTAGLSASYYLREKGLEHIVLERGVIANAWRRDRWNSFCLVTPNWSITLPGRPYSGDAPEGFMPLDEFNQILLDYAKWIEAPVHEGVNVTKVERRDRRIVVTHPGGQFRAKSVIVASGGYQRPRLLGFEDKIPDSVQQINANQYKSPNDLAEGSVLVVGSGQTGCQVASELRRSGRKVFLSVGRTGRLVRRYRGTDCSRWQLLLGNLDRRPEELASPSDRFKGDPHLSGRNGGETLNLSQFHRDGIQLVGSVTDVAGSKLSLKDNLAQNMEAADKFAEEFCQSIDDYIAANNIDAPAADDSNSMFGGEPLETYPNSPKELDLEKEAVSTIVWCTGFNFDFSWVEGPSYDTYGFPITERGRTTCDGIYFLGLNWLHTRKSGIIYGVGDDAEYVVTEIEKDLAP